jgi:hypothetical protein
MGFIRKAGAPKKSSPKRLFVHPSELAEKLIKEMEDHKTVERERVWAPARYTVYLCLDDYERLQPKAAKVQGYLVDQLYEHVEDMGYDLEEDIAVEIVLDKELELGRFGILAYPLRRAAQEVDVAGVGSPAPAARPSVAAGAGAGARVAAGAGSPAGAGVAAAAAGSAIPAVSAAGASVKEVAGEAGGAGPAQAPAGPAPSGGKVIVVRSGGEVREFGGGRVVIGRGRDVDFRIEDPGVSRRHAAVFFEADKLMLEDLGSTNGTLVNGYPITKTVLAPKDVVVIGQRRLIVEAK